MCLSLRVIPSATVDVSCHYLHFIGNEMRLKKDQVTELMWSLDYSSNIASILLKLIFLKMGTETIPPSHQFLMNVNKM